MNFSEQELKTIFTSSCVESAARSVGCNVSDMYARMKKVNLIEGYIWKFYEQLHSESREHVTEDVLETLKAWENRGDAFQRN